MKFNPKWIIGKRIKSVELRPFNRYEYSKGTTTDPVITFDDGSSIRFLTEETEVGEYGVAICYSKPSRAGKR